MVVIVVELVVIGVNDIIMTANMTVYNKETIDAHYYYKNTSKDTDVLCACYKHKLTKISG